MEVVLMSFALRITRCCELVIECSLEEELFLFGSSTSELSSERGGKRLAYDVAQGNIMAL